MYYLTTLPRLVGTLIASAAQLTSLPASERPNIVLIMADDMDFSNIGPYGGEIETPALDAPAKGGMKFSSFYNSGRCCPTRASLMIGLHLECPRSLNQLL